LASVLAGLGVVKGDQVLSYMPMVPEAAIAMLAGARIGPSTQSSSVGLPALATRTTPSRGSSCRPRAASRSTGSSSTSHCSKTRSGKILRGTMREIAEGEDYPLPATIDDPKVLAEIDRALATAGYAKR